MKRTKRAWLPLGYYQRAMVNTRPKNNSQIVGRCGRICETKLQ